MGNVLDFIFGLQGHKNDLNRCGRRSLRSCWRLILPPWPVNAPFLIPCSRLLSVFLAAGCLAFGPKTSAQAQRLTEFLAVNSTGIADEDGTRQPWVEIWNPSLTAVLTLTNYKLSNGTSLWTLPTLQIMPDERILIWASGKDRRVVTAPLHANFTLPTAAGSTLSLLNSTNIIVSSLANYPEQVADVSWGRDDSDAATTPTWVGPYASPTPGESNHKYGGDGMAGKVVFSETSRAYSGALSITLSQAVPEEGAVIRYTTNQTLPTAASTLYSAPIAFTATGPSTVIRARIFKPGKLPGPTATHGFLRLENNALNFSSAMPLVVISTFGATPPDDSDLNSFMWVWEPTGVDKRARFSNPPNITTRIVVDKRGSSTLGNPKYNLNVEMRQPYGEDEQDFPLMGMPSHADWVFHAPYDFDRSLLHNPLMYALSNAVGRYAVRNQMAEVFIDQTGSGLNFPGSGSGDYFGVYNVMEKIRRGAERVDVAKLETYDNTPATKSGGYIFKVDRLDSGDSGFNAAGQTLAYYYPKERDLKSPQRDPQEQYLTTFMNEFYTRLQGANWKDPLLGYATHLNVPAAVDHHLLNVWSFNVDALRLSGYWTKDRGGKVFPGPIWDFDRTLSSTDGRDANPLVWRSTVSDMGTDFFNHPWWNRLFLDANFYQKYVDRWQELRRGALSRANLEAMIDSLDSQITAEAIKRDLARWNMAKRAWKRPFAAPDNNNILASQAAEVQRLKDYLQQRATFMDSQWVGPVTASAASGFVTAGTKVTLSGPAGVPIYYTLSGTDPRPSGGAAAGATATLYSGPIEITANTRLMARAYKATHTALIGANNPPLVCKWSGLADQSYTTESPVGPGDLMVSEINYHPMGPTPAESAVNLAWTEDDFEFIELRNISGHTVHLAGATFTRGVSFSFAGGAARSIAAGECLVLVANPAAFAARYGSALAVSGPWTGSLSNGSETIALTGATGLEVLSVSYRDEWVPEADQGGFSMVAYECYPLDFSGAPAWRSSAAAGGSPGAWDAASLAITAGPDLTVNPSIPMTLRGEIVAPSAALGAEAPVLAWTQISGPGTLRFADPAAATTSATADLPGAYRIKLSLTAKGVTSSDEAKVFAVDTPAAWLERHPGIGVLSDDPDQDGRSNFLEFALFTGSSAPDGSAPPIVEVQGNRLTLVYQRHKAASGLSYAVEISDGASFRAPNPGELSETILDDSGTTQTVRVTDSAPLGTPLRRFLRLKVTSP